MTFFEESSKTYIPTWAGLSSLFSRSWRSTVLSGRQHCALALTCISAIRSMDKARSCGHFFCHSNVVLPEIFFRLCRRTRAGNASCKRVAFRNVFLKCFQRCTHYLSIVGFPRSSSAEIKGLQVISAPGPSASVPAPHCCLPADSPDRSRR